MNEKERILLYSYIYNNTHMLENEVQQLQSNLRFLPIDTVDCLELALALQRLETFREVAEHIIALVGGHWKNDL